MGAGLGDRSALLSSGARRLRPRTGPDTAGARILPIVHPLYGLPTGAAGNMYVESHSSETPHTWHRRTVKE